MDSLSPHADRHDRIGVAASNLADMRLLFIDMYTPKPYSLNTLATEGIGCSESSVIRIAEAFDGHVLQHNREVPDGRYLPLDTRIDATHVVACREPVAALQAVERFPGAKVYLWLHDLCGPESNRGRRIIDSAAALGHAGVTILGVSKFHADQIGQTLRASGADRLPAYGHVYNPIAVPDLDLSGWDPDQLIFFSSPHKGLEFTLKIFEDLRRRLPSLKLLIANPGYMRDLGGTMPGVHFLGPLPHREVLQHVARSLCTFMPNYIFEETFGCVLAESNAVGTPVLAHPIGAAPEVLADENQLLAVPGSRRYVDAIARRAPRLRDSLESLSARLGAFDRYWHRIEHWRSGNRPQVALNEAFRLESVVVAWNRWLAAA